MTIDKDKAVEAQYHACNKSEFKGALDALLTADQLRELLDENERLKISLEQVYQEDAVVAKHIFEKICEERDRYKAALEIIASSNNCGTCDACLRAAKDALKP